MTWDSPAAKSGAVNERSALSEIGVEDLRALSSLIKSQVMRWLSFTNSHALIGVRDPRIRRPVHLAESSTAMADLGVGHMHVVCIQMRF